MHYLDGQEGDAGSLIAESKVDALFSDRDALHLSIDVHLTVGIESTFACCYST